MRRNIPSRNPTMFQMFPFSWRFLRIQSPGILRERKRVHITVISCPNSAALSSRDRCGPEITGDFGTCIIARRDPVNSLQINSDNYGLINFPFHGLNKFLTARSSEFRLRALLQFESGCDTESAKRAQIRWQLPDCNCGTVKISRN
jgi:hypothetical protein